MESRTSRRRSDKRGSGAKGRKGMANFVSKLVDILENANPRLAGWTPSGTAFLVHDPKRFGAEVLAKVFKSGNFSSFIRQLNFYSFHKNVQSEAAWEFSHPCFVRGRPDLMAQIKRKTSSEYHASYDVELAKLRASLAESQATIASLRAQLDAATATITRQQREAAVAKAIAAEANRRLAASGLPTVTEADCGSIAVGTTRLASASVGASTSASA